MNKSHLSFGLGVYVLILISVIILVGLSLVPNTVSAGNLINRAPEAQGHIYDRDDWKHWSDFDRDCMNTRHEVLKSESRKPVTLSKNGCYVVTGEWHDPYTGKVFTRAKDLDVDHVVALKEAHDSGGWAWDAKTRQDFANNMRDPNHLIAVEAKTNRSKSARDPAEWLPPNKDHHCQYILDWVNIKKNYGLTMDEKEVSAILDVIQTQKCK